MRKILYLLLALMLLTSCRSKKVNKTEHKEEQKTERKEVKDSATRVEKSQKVSTFEIQQSQLYEIILESDKDSVGNAKDVVYYRARDGDSETIRVQGGKVTIKTIDNLSKSLQQADSTLYIDNKISQRSETQSQYTQATKQVQKDTKTIPFALIIGALLIGAIALLLWRLKLFR
nr:MAG TPA: Protein involved in gliding motility 9 Secretion System Type.5A [Caudoviricetes sp.]DAY22763.1 MAG TPA: Protein involved in gliding motility 9 Secretion System Type.5A [Caudoviricetes sp.]